MKFPNENKKLANKLKQLNKFSSVINKSNDIWDKKIKTVCFKIENTHQSSKVKPSQTNEKDENDELSKRQSLFKVVKPELPIDNQNLLELNENQVKTEDEKKKQVSNSLLFSIGNWTNEEDELLLYLRNTLKLKTWVSIKQFFDTKNSKQCAYRYKKLSQNKKIIWSNEEDIALVNLINTHGENFEYLRVFFPDKSVIDIKKRYYSKLYYRRFSFTPEEDYSIISLYLNMEISEEEKMNIRNKFSDSLKKRLKMLLKIRNEKQSDININSINSLNSLKTIIDISSRLNKYNKNNKKHQYCEDMDDDDLHISKINSMKYNNYNDNNEDIVSQIFSNTVITSSETHENDQNFPYIYKKYEFERMFPENQTVYSDTELKNQSSTMRNSNKHEYSNSSLVSMSHMNNFINISNSQEDGCCIYKNNNLYINNETNQYDNNNLNNKFLNNTFLTSKFLTDNQKDYEKSLLSKFNTLKTKELLMKKENLKELLQQINSLSSIFCEGFEKKVWMSVLSNDEKICLIGKYIAIHKRISCIFQENEKLSVKVIQDENDFVKFLYCKIEFINELILLEKKRLSLLEGLYCD